jgi:hypothetical protein
MGKERELQILGTSLGMAAVVLLAALTAITIAVMVGGHLRSALPASSSPQSPGAPLGVVEQRSSE